MAQRVVVIGAGIAGLATAVALQRREYDVSIIEQRADTSTGAAISIWPNALAALDNLGLGDAVRASGGRITAGALRWCDGSWLRHLETERLVAALGEPLVVVQRCTLRDLLTGAVREGTAEYGLAADGLVATPDGMQIRLSDATVRHADAVIGADGIGSMVARHLNGPLTHRYAGYTAWRGIAAHAMDPELAGGTLGPGVETGHVPVGPDRTYWYATERAHEGRLSPGGELPYLRARLARTHPQRIGRDDPGRRVAQRPLRPPSLVRESALIGRVINLRPAFLGAAATRATRLMPEALFTRHLASVAARAAFVLPTGGT